MVQVMAMDENSRGHHPRFSSRKLRIRGFERLLLFFPTHLEMVLQSQATTSNERLWLSMATLLGVYDIKNGSTVPFHICTFFFSEAIIDSRFSAAYLAEAFLGKSLPKASIN